MRTEPSAAMAEIADPEPKEKSMRADIFRSGLVGFAFVGALLCLPVAALAQAMTYTVELSGANTNPPIETEATGTAEVTFDPATRVLTWSVTVEGLSGDATAAHFHGPAAADANAGVVVPIDHAVMPMAGEATLTEEQATQLTDGLWYINVHTAANPGGEIRGQVQ
jgi:CHRD domain